jgi:NADH:ubiquinone oxidoreductase subunit 2 (subunit N)
MSLGGLPPLLGFIAKLNAIFVIANFSRIPVLLSLIASSLVSLFYYIKLTYRRLTIYPSKLFKSIKITANKSLLNLIFYTVVAGNIATPLIVSLI